MIKRLIRNICRRIYLIGKTQATKMLLEEGMRKMNVETTVHATTIVTEEARVYNLTNDPGKIRIGAHTLIRGELLTYNYGGEIVIGDYCFIGPQSKIWSVKKVVIGNRVLISHNVNIHDNNSHAMLSAQRHEDFKYMLENSGNLRESDLGQKEVIIEDDVWIGLNSIILPGVKIGKGSIIGAGSIVTKDIPPFSVAIGNPAKVIKSSQ
jgi:acetyltransferase-like isoleucine patch superfamily enzyme